MLAGMKMKPPVTFNIFVSILCRLSSFYPFWFNFYNCLRLILGADITWRIWVSITGNFVCNGSILIQINIVALNRECWMENMMTFQNSHFTWLEASRRSLPRPRRLPRNQLPNQISCSSLPCSFSMLLAWLLRKSII